jgi:DNA-binding NarL/FixJ family response regulator
VYKVVVVDDQKMVTTSVVKILETHFDDLEIYALNDPYEALGFILSKKPNIVIIDRIMELSGIRLLKLILEIYRPSSIMISDDPVVYMEFDYVMNKSKLADELPKTMKNIIDGQNKRYFNNSIAYEFLIRYRPFNVIDNKNLDIILTTMDETNETKFSKILDKVGVSLGVESRSVRRIIDQILKSTAFRGSKMKPKDFILKLYEDYMEKKPIIEEEREMLKGRLNRR